MSGNVMKIAGKDNLGNVKAVSIDDKGAVIAKRIWESKMVTVFSGDIRDAEMHNTLNKPVDLTDQGFVSFRIYNSTDKPFTFYIYDDTWIDSSSYIKTLKGEYPQFIIQPGYTVIITPDDLPLLNYLMYAKFRFKAFEAPTKGAVTIRVVTKR